MSKQAKILLKRVLLTIGISFVGVPLLLYGGLLLTRSPRTDKLQPLFQGIVYQRDARHSPRRLMIHVVSIDLTQLGIRFLVTPGDSSGGQEIRARTTSEFLSEFKLQLAINGSFFKPFHEHHPLDYYPYSGDRVDILGQAISNGTQYSPVQPGWPMLCISAEQRAKISRQPCPTGTVQAIAGGELLVEQGKSIARGNTREQKKLSPRTAVAIDERGEKLWLVLVDGRQLLYSEGVTLTELTSLIMELGAYTALNLDGGGSTTLVSASRWGVRLLNAPIHTRIPMRQRPIANHLGIYALPKD